jgi:hypothetical protein
MFGLPGLADLSPLLNLAMTPLALLDQQRAEVEAKNANRDVANVAGGMLGAMSDGALNYANLTDSGVPQFSYNAQQDIDKTYGGLLGLLRGNQAAGLADYGRLAGDLTKAMGSEQNALLGQYNRGSGDLLKRYTESQGALMGEFDQGAAGLLDAARQRQATGMALLEGMGDQARKDIDRDYKASGNAQQMQLAQRGFGSGSLLTGALRGNERERQDAQGRLNESLRGQRLNTYGALSGDVLNTQGNNFSNRMNLSSGLEQGRMGLLGQNFGGLMSLLGGQSAERLNLGSMLANNQYNLQQANRGDEYNLLAQQAAQKLAQNQNAAANAYNLVTGIQNPYPSTNAFDLGQQMGLGYGANRSAVMQENALHRAQSPWNSFWGPLAGGTVGGLTSGFTGTAGALGAGKMFGLF